MQEDMLVCKKNLQIWCTTCIRYHDIVSSEVRLESFWSINIYDLKSMALYRTEFSGLHLSLFCRWYFVFSREIAQFQQLFCLFQKVYWRTKVGSRKGNENDWGYEKNQNKLFWKIRPFFHFRGKIKEGDKVK